MFVHLTKRTQFLVRVRLFNKRTNTNEPPTKQFTNCLLNVWFICSPTTTYKRINKRFTFDERLHQAQHQYYLPEVPKSFYH
ncbi:hypothetical protein Hanom_Chr01g00077581 [Helianthus anomalus]